MELFHFLVRFQRTYFGSRPLFVGIKCLQSVESRLYCRSDSIDVTRCVQDSFECTTRTEVVKQSRVQNAILEERPTQVPSERLTEVH